MANWNDIIDNIIPALENYQLLHWRDCVLWSANTNILVPVEKNSGLPGAAWPDWRGRHGKHSFSPYWLCQSLNTTMYVFGADL